MNLAQRITVGVTLLLMGFATYQEFFTVSGGTPKLMWVVPELMLIAFVGGGLFVLFGIKRKKKNKE